MKKISSILLAAATTAMLALGWSCDQKNPEPDVIPDPTLEVTLTEATDPNFAATSATFNILSTRLESFVYKVEEGENKPAPDPAMLYAEAKEITKVTAEKQQVSIYGMEGSKKYTVHFAFKIDGQAKYIGKSISASTPAYNQLINIIAADRHEIKVHFNIAAGSHYRYVIIDKLTYYDFRSYGAGDIDILGMGTQAQGPLTVTYFDGQEIPDPYGDESSYNIVKPGTAFVVLYAQCNEEGTIAMEMNGGGGGGDPLMTGSTTKPNVKNYTEVCADDWYTLPDPYAKFELWTAAPIKGEGEFKIEKKITSMNATFKITPPASVGKYGVAIIPKSVYTDVIIPIVGEDGAMSILLTQFTSAFSGEQIVSAGRSLTVDTLYMFAVIGLCEEAGGTQIFYTEEFTPKASTKAAVEIVITPVDSPDNSPYYASYNVKAPNKDCFDAKYLMNYSKEWVKVIKGDVTHETMVNSQGVQLKTDEIESINSANGLVMTFPSYEDMENLIAICAYTDDDKISTFTKSSRSKPEPAKEKIESDLFTSLEGAWDIEYTHSLAGAAAKVGKFSTVIAGAPETAPDSFLPGDKQYNALHTFYKRKGTSKGMTDAEATQYATDEVAAQLVLYKESQARYAKKYRDQNRMVIRGFAYHATYPGLKYTSPWSLFCDTYYQSYDNDQLFFDYGSKLFLEVKKVDGKEALVLETNSQSVFPFSNYSMVKHIALGINDKTLVSGAFPVKIIDADTFEIEHQFTYENMKYSFMTGYASGGAYAVHSMATANIVFKRKATPAPTPAPASYSPTLVNDMAKERAAFDFKRTTLNTFIPEREAVEVPIATDLKKSTNVKYPKTISR